MRVAVDLFNRQGYDATVRSSVTVLVDHLPAVTLLLRVHGNTPVEKAALARRRGIDERLADMVREAADDGVLRDDLDPLVISRLLFGMVNSLVEWVRPGVEAAPLTDAVVALAFDGLTHETHSPGQAGSGSGRGTPR